MQATAVGQVRPDDAGDTQQTAGVLHVGVNDGYSEYQLPRRPDVDVWGLQTQAGRIYRITSGPIDAPWEVFTLDPSFYQPLSTAWALVELGYTAEARWLSGGGGIEYLTILGAARATGEPRRYQVVVDSFADPGDPEPDIESEGILLSDGEWYSGTLTPDRRLPDRVVPDVDCFRFACSDGGVYRAEILLTSGAAPGVWSPSFYTQIRGVPVSSDHPAGSPCLVNLYNGMYKAVGDCTLTINLRWNERYALSHFYRVGVTRVSSAPTDDHGNTSDRATFLRPPTLGSVRVDGAIGGPGVFNYPPAASTRGDIDWFAVELAPGRACTVDVLRAGLYPYLPQDLSYSNQSGLRVVGEVAEWGALGSCEAALPATPGSSSVPVKSMRFRSRDDGRPIRFGLAGPPGTYRVVAADLGPVTDMTGDPHTNGAAVVRVEEPVAGSLEYPTDVDSLLIERPTAPGIYRLRCRYTVPNSPNSVIFPGFSLVRSVGPEQYTRTTQFHVQDASVSMTSLGGAGLDSFPARLDLLNKRYPEGSFPATGPAHSYNVSLDYVGPVTTSHLIGPSADDEAPATLAGAPTVQVGVPFQARRHLGGDLADVFAVQLVAGRTYCYSTGHYWAALSALDPSGAPIDDGDWVPVPDGPEGTFERRFVAPITGLYGLKVSYRQYDNFAVSTACVISDHGISGDTPAADWPAKLQEGSTTGTIHYPGDRDVFEIPWEAGTAYRLRITGGSDVSVLRAANYTYQPAADEPVFYYYVPFGVPRNSDPITVRGLTVGQHYTLTIERIGRLHPTDGVVEGPLGWPVVRLGERATLFSLAPLQPVRFGVRVEANRWYRFDLSSAFLNQTEAPSYVWGSFFDENGAFLHRWSLGDPFFAHDSGVLWVQPDYAPSWPLYAEQMDLGPGSDEGGPSLEQPATVRLGEIIEATIDRPGDRDTWQTQGLDRGGYALVFVDSNGQELRRSDWRLSGWQITALVDDTIVAPKAVFPFAYRVMIVEQPILPPVTPLPFCIGDFASAGARAGGDRRRDNNDLIFFINAFFANQRSADIASAGAVIGGDGWLDNNDLVVMLDLMFTPCP
ncbi:MAG TPA: GC-type dockerin domain-anchored protein [Phycisphaerales bacterium]|nr:GC-type dockerin domain-anchored protein [Phycisphaerales bacterium]